MAGSAEKIVHDVKSLGPRPTVDAVLDYFFQAAGGTVAFGKMLHTEYVASQPGSMIRAKIIELVMRRMERAEERNRVDDFAGLTEKDLEVAIAAREKAMVELVESMAKEAGYAGEGEPGATGGDPEHPPPVAG